MSMKKLFIANWKMQLLPGEAVKIAKEMVKKFKDIDSKVEVALAPSHESLAAVGVEISESNLALAAQDCFWEAKGAFTGEVSTESLRALGVEYVLVGHSERRQYLGETDEMTAKKLRSALRAGVTPVLCCGETIEEREGGKTEDVISRELRAALTSLKVEKEKLVVAYEPIWAIGTGRAATPADIGKAHYFIRGLLREFLPRAGAKVRIIYGGSVSAANICEILEAPETSGALVGGSSLRGDEFEQIVRSKS